MGVLGPNCRASGVPDVYTAASIRVVKIRFVMKFAPTATKRALKVGAQACVAIAGLGACWAGTLDHAGLPAENPGKSQIAISFHETDRSTALTMLKAMSVEPTADRLVQYAAQSDLTAVKLLLAAGVPARATNTIHGATALHNAAAQGHLELIRLLLDQGGKINARDVRGATPLCVASFYGQVAAAQLLLERGAAVKAEPGSSTFPLLAATQSGNAQMVALLLSHGAHPQDATNEGMTAGQAARLARRYAVLRQLQASMDSRKP